MMYLYIVPEKRQFDIYGAEMINLKSVRNFEQSLVHLIAPQFFLQCNLFLFGVRNDPSPSLFSSIHIHGILKKNRDCRFFRTSFLANLG